MPERIVVIGGAGNVGRGVVEAMNNDSWEVEIVDPQENSTFEDLSDEGLKEVLGGVEHVVYTAENGNRDEYDNNPGLGEENNERFKQFCERIAAINKGITVWYVGGSWTKRIHDEPVINDKTENKDDKDCNPYELAKKAAEENAEVLTSKLGIKIRYLDWASIVPNMADNFSIPTMVRQAVEDGLIKYSPGNFGRPLLEVVQAGEALIILIKNDTNEPFRKVLIPGEFVDFKTFAETVKQVVEKETGKEIGFEEITGTPDWLKTKSESEYLQLLGFKPDRQRVLKALEDNARDYLSKLQRD